MGLVDEPEGQGCVNTLACVLLVVVFGILAFVRIRAKDEDEVL